MRRLLIGVYLLTCPAAYADSTCPDELKAEVLHNLWKRPPAPKPSRASAMLRVSYRNEYGHPADALLIAVDGAAKHLGCAAPEDRGEVFVGPLAPGVHYVDAVYNFGPGRVGRTPYAFRMKSGRDLTITIVLDRDEHEHPTAHFESTRSRSKGEPARRACLEKCEHRNMNADCADEDGHMMPCPCHCD